MKIGIQYVGGLLDETELREIRALAKDHGYELKENDIGCEIYYPVSFHKQECFQDLMKDPQNGMEMDQYPVSDFSADHSLALPVYPELQEEQIRFVVETIKNFFNN